MQTNLAKLMAVAFTIIAIVAESAMIVSGLMYNLNERVITGMCGLVVLVPLVASMWRDLRKQNA